VVGLADHAFHDEDRIMQRYKNLSGDSAIVAYDNDAGQISVEFRDGWRYLYTEDSAGAANVAKMQALAEAGHGLSGFISQHVRDRYARKTHRPKFD
jgi:hypothetical protein